MHITYIEAKRVGLRTAAAFFALSLILSKAISAQSVRLSPPMTPSRLAQEFDSGDHLHPSPKGNKAMADGIFLALFSR